MVPLHRLGRGMAGRGCAGEAALRRDPGPVRLEPDSGLVGRGPRRGHGSGACRRRRGVLLPQLQHARRRPMATEVPASPSSCPCGPVGKGTWRVSPWSAPADRSRWTPKAILPWRSRATRAPDRCGTSRGIRRPPAPGRHGRGRTRRRGRGWRCPSAARSPHPSTGEDERCPFWFLGRSSAAHSVTRPAGRVTRSPAPEPRQPAF